MIIDIHGHYTTAPKALEAWRNRQVAGIKDASAMPKPSELDIGDDELRESIESNQLRLMRERGSDVTLFSPRASFMAHRRRRSPIGTGIRSTRRWSSTPYRR
jgi:4-oxalmesaconate hydratase